MIKVEHTNKTFSGKYGEVHALQDVSIHVEKGDIYGIIGFSGAGKSTLLRLVNGLETPDSGTVMVHDQDLGSLKKAELRKLRRKIGMVFQQFNLLDSKTVFHNIALPLILEKAPKDVIEKKVNEVLRFVELEDKKDTYVSQLSGGQKQRVGIARALTTTPDILLCDEATSALDPKTTLQILALLKKLNRQLGLTIVLITHEMQVVKEICNKVAVMEDGRIIEKGSSIQIFSNPEEELTKDFIRTATHLDQALETIIAHSAFADQIANKWLVELSYIGNQTNEPLIAHLYSKYQVTANILYGNVELLQETPLGSLIVTLAGETKQRQKALDYLIKSGVKINILQKNELDSRIKVIEGGR